MEPESVTTPVTKKLKQARLPFQLLTSKPTPDNPSVEPKKRKLSEGATGPLKPPKTPKSSEKVAKKVEEASEHVSSSSEATPVAIVIDENISPKKGKSVKVGLMDKYVTPTQKAEVSTSCLEDLADSVSDAEEDEEGGEEKEEGGEEKEEEPVCTPKRATSACSVMLSPLASKISQLEGVMTIDMRTPPSTKRSRPKTPVSVSSKEKEEARLKKKEEKEKLKVEKQRLKDEKEKLRLEEKEKKEVEKREAKEKKEREKQELQKEKDEKQRIKDEEKRKKQEVIDAKNEEKKKKDDEKKKKEEEKAKEEEEKVTKQHKEQAYFKNFFKKSDKSTSKLTEEVVVKKGPFMAFEVKKDMRVAPTLRVEFSKKDQLDKLMNTQDVSQLYLNEVKLGKRRLIGKDARTWPLEHDVELMDANVGEKMSTKFLQFSENHRPAYYGTWRKTSTKLTPRNPFTKDGSLFDYEVESDDEWEEEEPGESLSNSEGEGDGDGEAENSDREDDADEDGFFVPHGYLSEGEGAGSEEEEVSPEKLKARQLAKARAWDVEMGKECKVLRPMCFGCCWWSPADIDGVRSNPNLELLSRFTVQLINQTAPIVLDDLKREKSGEEPSRRGGKSKEVPEEALADLIRLVHGNRFSIQKIIREFCDFWTTKKGSTDSSAHFISKRQLDVKIRSIANYERAVNHGKKYWLVKESVLEAHDLKDLPVPTAWEWTTLSTPKKADKNEDSITEEPATAKKSNFSMKKFAIVRDSPVFVSPPPSKPQESSTPKAPPVESVQPKSDVAMKPVDLFAGKGSLPPKESPLQQMFNNLKQPKSDDSAKSDEKKSEIVSDVEKSEKKLEICSGSAESPMIID